MGRDKYYLVGGSESLYSVDLGGLQGRFVQKIQGYLPTNEVEWVPLTIVREGLKEQLVHATDAFPNAIVVALSALYYPDAEFKISANRLVDITKKKIGLSNRPHTEPLDMQIKYVMEKADDRPVIVVDDTLFHGETIEYLMGKGLRVDAAVEYFSTKEAIDKFTEEGVQVFTSNNLQGYVDVMPLHDFLPPMPLCGKVIGLKPEDKDPVPLMLEDGKVSLSVPYLVPWLTPEELQVWASIPAEHAIEFSAFALGEAISAFEKLYHVGLTSLKGAILSSKEHRMSYPYLSEMPVQGNIGISRFLERFLHLAENFVRTDTEGAQA